MPRTRTSPFSRREFLKLSGATSLGLALTACNLAAPMPTALPAPTDTQPATAASTPTSMRAPTLMRTPTLAQTPTNTPRPSATPAPTKTPGPPTLRELADNARIKLGAAVNGPLLFPDNPQYDKRYLPIFQRDFNLGIIKDAAFWDGCERVAGKEEDGCILFVERQIKALQQIGIHDLRWHTLLYPKYSPQWLRVGVWNGSIGKDQLVEHMTRRISSVVNRSKDSITEWVVVNEPYRHWGDPLDPSKGDNDFFQNALGDEYIDMAFQIVRGLDPKGTLILNDTLNSASRGYHSVFNTSQAERTQQTRTIVNRLKEKGLIDAVGVQMHLDGAHPPDKDDVIKTIQSYGAPVFVTEFDVDMRNVGGTQEERFAKQAKIYADSLGACLQSSVCNSFSVYDWGDKQSYSENPQFGGVPNANATPYDDDLQPKPAWHALYDVLSQLSFPQQPNAVAASSTP